MRLVAAVIDRKDLSGDEAKALLRVLGEYSQALDLLDDYDHQRVGVPDVTSQAVHMLSYEEATRVIGRLRDQFGDSALFGVEKDKWHARGRSQVRTLRGGEGAGDTLRSERNRCPPRRLPIC